LSHNKDIDFGIDERAEVVAVVVVCGGDASYAHGSDAVLSVHKAEFEFLFELI